MKPVPNTVLFILACIVFSLSCSKSKSSGDGCEPRGGIIPYNVYVFWIKSDFGCGPITVQVKDASGNDVASFYKQIKFLSGAAPACDPANYTKYAFFNTNYGELYSYTASCSGKSWNGSFRVPCEPGTCENIELK